MKAYLRVSPLIDEHKAHYSDGEFRAFLKAVCAASRQPTRGRFRNEMQLRELLGRHGKFVAFLIAEGDVTRQGDGSLYVDGWDEWQEGDFTVADRMAALRNRKRNGAVTDTVTGDVTAPVTPTVTRPSPDANANANAVTPLVGVGSGEGLYPNIAGEAVTFLEGMTGRTIRQAGERNLLEYDRQIADHGLTSVIGAYRKASKAFSSKPTARQLVWSARSVLEPFADAKQLTEEVRREDSELEAQKRSERIQAQMEARRREMERFTRKGDAA